jgi:hypothetical protein
VSHELRQFVLCCLPARFDEFDDEGVYVHHNPLYHWMADVSKHATRSTQYATR